MPTRTVSTTGGNFNATSSWTGGVVPLTTDDIIADATSGPLTINVASTVTGFNFTNYTSTLTLTANFASQGNATMSFGSSMSIVGNGWIASSSGTKNMRSNGLTIPKFGVAGNATVCTLLDNFTIDEFLVSPTNNQNAINGFSIYTKKITGTGSIGGGFQSNSLIGTTALRFENPSGAIWDINYSSMEFQTPIYINLNGYMTFSANSYINIVSGYTFSLISGTISGDPNLIMQSRSNNRLFYNLGSNTVWNRVFIAEVITGGTFSCELLDDLRFNYMATGVRASGNVNYWGPSGGTRASIRFYGNKRLIGGSVNMFPFSDLLGGVGATPKWDGQPFELWLPSGQTHSFTELNTSGLPQNRGLIRAATASSPTYISVSGTQSIVYTTFRDVYSSNAIYTFGGSTSNTQNIFVANTMVPNSSSIFIE